jgi:hypothetical protein
MYTCYNFRQYRNIEEANKNVCYLYMNLYFDG